MSTNDTKGVCRFCLKSFSGRSMSRHIATCNIKNEKDATTAAGKKRKDIIYYIKISGYKVYWLYIEMKGTKKLSDLDKFLRNIWLECCGHLSEFDIGGEKFLSHRIDDDVFGGGIGPPSKSMNVQLQRVLKEKDKFTYDYDFGSTTHLEGQIVAVREGYLKEPVKILARNNPFTFNCEMCDKPATWICTECGDFYCENCLPKHECGEEMRLPAVNSPRMGECGYGGEYDTDDFYEKLQQSI